MKIDKKTEENLHVGDVTSICVYKDHVFSAGSDGKIKIWDLDLKFVKEISIHEAYIYVIIVDKNGRLYSSCCDGCIKFIDKPLESEDAKILLQHENEIEAFFVDDDNKFYCGDSMGGVACFENGTFKFKMNIVENVKSLFVEGKLVYTLLNLDLSVHEIRDSGNYSHLASIPGKFPVTLFGERINGRSEFIAILTRDGKGVTVVENSKFKTITTKDNMHEMIVNAMKSTKNFLFTGDYAGNVVKSQMINGELKIIDSGNLESGCVNSIATLDENTIFAANGDGTIKKIIF